MSFYVIHPREIELARQQKKAMIVDIREKCEYQKYHYKNAINIPYREGEGWLDKFGKGCCYILYCDYGNMSLLAARKLGKRGIEVYTVVGGMQGIHRYRSRSE